MGDGLRGGAWRRWVPHLERENSMSTKLKKWHEETVSLVLRTTSVRAVRGRVDCSYTTKASRKLA